MMSKETKKDKDLKTKWWTENQNQGIIRLSENRNKPIVYNLTADI